MSLEITRLIRSNRFETSFVLGFRLNFSLVRTQPVTRILKVDVRVVHVRRPLAIG